MYSVALTDDDWTSAIMCSKVKGRDFPGGTVVKNQPANAGDMVQSLVWEDSHMPQSN